MKFYGVIPQVAGEFGENTIRGDVRDRPPKITRFHYELKLWPEDDLLEALGTYAGTIRLAEGIKSLGLTGIEFDSVEVTKGDQFWKYELKHPNEQLPELLWFKITGKAGIDDFGMLEGPVLFPLVVSERALQLLQSLNSNHLQVEEYRSASAQRGS